MHQVVFIFDRSRLAMHLMGLDKRFLRDQTISIIALGNEDDDLKSSLLKYANHRHVCKDNKIFSALNLDRCPTLANNSWTSIQMESAENLICSEKDQLISDVASILWWW